MKKTLTILTALLLLAITPVAAKITHLLPKPHEITTQQGSFTLGRPVTIKYNGVEACTLLEEFFASTGCTIGTDGAEVTVTIVDKIEGTYDYELSGFDNEAYTIAVRDESINITAVKPIGVIRATQTLTQLAEGYEGTASIEAVDIKDWAAFKLRGYMHDVGRSFISVPELKKHIELLSRFKVNCFHWHFTENQAWRLQINAYPQLTSEASMTRFPGKYYTQEQCREVAAHAKKYGITIIPEIDMPGHSEAFVRAMGYDMQSDKGVAALKVILDEVVALFPDAPYIHIGADEKGITYPNFLGIMTGHLHNKNKKVVVWNPISGVNVGSTDADMTQMWSTAGRQIDGKANIDCRYNYTNHFDVFADVVGIYRSNIYYEQQGNKNIAGTISAYWNDRKTPTEEDIIKQNNMYANVIASAERGWIGGGKQYIEVGGTTLPNSGDEYNEFADWERRFLFHKANSLKDEPIPYVKQTNVRWRITDAFPNGGDMNAQFAPETEGPKESYTVDGVTYSTGMATGAGIYLRHTWGSTIPTYFSNPQLSTTAYAWTYVYSETAQSVGAQIEFQNYGRSEKDTAPDKGKWDRKGSRIWLNDQEILPPTWDNTGKSINNEVDLGNENFTARKPVKVQLNAGWNKVFIKLPYVAASGVRLNKWMFTFVLTDLDGRDAVDGLIYSPNKCKDEAAEQIAASISEIKKFIASVTGEKPGYYSPATASALIETIAKIQATLEQELSAEERNRQAKELDDALDAFKAYYPTTPLNQPLVSNSQTSYYYTLSTPLREGRYATSKGAGNEIYGEKTVTNAAKWKFVERGDGTYDIVNYSDASYISPSSSNNTALRTQSSSPTKGWTLKPADAPGYFIIVSGTAQFNQTTSGQSYKLFNWGSGTNTTDAGCKYSIELISNEGGDGDTSALDYTPNYTGTKGGDRPLNFIKLESPSYGTAEYKLSNNELTQLYVDATKSVTLKVGAGDEVFPTAGYGAVWMHAYVYIDTDKNGFTAGIGADGYSPTDDLVSYSAYNANPDGGGAWRNSAGENNGNNTVVLPSFTAPTTKGTYRMRFKIDWNSIDPAGCTDPGNRLDSNRGAIVDVTLEVADKQQGTVEQLFNTTTIADNQFAQGTSWYTLQIGANGYVIDNNGTSNHIALDDVISSPTDDAQLWAFTGDNTNGYRLYNKQAGATKVLAAPTTMTGTTGSTSYPILVDAKAIPNGYTDLWMFQSSSDLGEGDTYYYMYEKGYRNNKVNNRDNKLAFWNGGADAGSTLNIQFAQAEYPINTLSGSWTASNPAGTWASAWQSTQTPKITLAETAARNNMAAYNDNGDIQLFTCLAGAAVNGQHTATYSISADEGYSIEGYRLSFVSSGTTDVSITPEGKESITASSTQPQSVVVEGVEEPALTFTVSATSNMFANTSNFYATIVRSSLPVEPSQEIFTTKKGAIPYRIPAIATAKNGNLIAVADYRHSGADIGVVNKGRIDLHARISTDNGATWNPKFAIVEGQGASSPDFMHVGFGDPCIVADRESNRVLVLSCAGNVSFQAGSRSNHQNIARFYSDDNGANWSQPEDIAESIYSQFDNSPIGPVMAMFIGSGKIHQSRYVKVNNYYRLYCAVLAKDRSANYINFVLYSDDFGGSWKVLGTTSRGHCTGADEPKVEELPNGNIILSSRTTGGRHYNIFTFTDAQKAQGSWGTQATSNSNVGGVVAVGNSTNGEILILPVVRNEDNAEMWIALQSVPFGSGRNNVGIYYKELASEDDYNTPANFAKDWDGRHQASYLPSAYSTMCLQADGTIAFLYEESTYGADYTIQYKNYTLETITDGAYSLLGGGSGTGIESVTAGTPHSGIYDLQGRRVENPKKGIYIVNGRKVFIK